MKKLIIAIASLLAVFMVSSTTYAATITKTATVDITDVYKEQRPIPKFVKHAFLTSTSVEYDDVMIQFMVDDTIFTMSNSQLTTQMSVANANALKSATDGRYKITYQLDVTRDGQPVSTDGNVAIQIKSIERVSAKKTKLKDFDESLMTNSVVTFGVD